MFRTLFFQDLKCLKNLFSSHSVFGISRIVHNPIADRKHTARIKPAADGLRDLTDRLLQKLNMSKIIEIDNRSHPVGILKFFRRRGIGRNVICSPRQSNASPASALSERNSHSRSHTPEGSESDRDWGRLFRKVFPESGIPGECLF